MSHFLNIQYSKSSSLCLQTRSHTNQVFFHIESQLFLHTYIKNQKQNMQFIHCPPFTSCTGKTRQYFLFECHVLHLLSSISISIKDTLNKRLLSALVDNFIVKLSKSLFSDIQSSVSVILFFPLTLVPISADYVSHHCVCRRCVALCRNCLL